MVCVLWMVFLVAKRRKYCVSLVGLYQVFVSRFFRTASVFTQLVNLFPLFCPTIQTLHLYLPGLPFCCRKALPFLRAFCLAPKALKPACSLCHLQGLEDDWTKCLNMVGFIFSQCFKNSLTLWFHIEYWDQQEKLLQVKSKELYVSSRRTHIACHFVSFRSFIICIFCM